MNILQKLIKIITRDRWALVPTEPSNELLHSMALRSDHSFGMSNGYSDQEIRNMKIENPIEGSYMLTSFERESILTSMRQLHEEVVGKGFYKL